MTRNTRKRLKRAARMYRRREFAHLISYLEPQVFMFRESYRFYYLLGMSCLHSGDISGAYSYLQRAITIEEDPKALLGLGAVFLRRRQTDEAIARYLDVLDLDRDNTRAKRALRWLRGVEAPDEALNWFESGQVRRILPRIGPYVPRSLVVLLSIAAIAGVVYFLWDPITTLPGRIIDREERSGSEFTRLERGEELVREENGARYVLDATEVEDLFANMQRNFSDRRDNLVRRDINRITLSNASDAVKQRAEYLRDYLEVPDFTDFADGFSFQEVAEDPPLYHDTFVRWRGRVANLDIGEERIRFDLLVGYETGQVLVGIVPAVLDFAVILRNNDPIEVIGRLDAVSNNPIALAVTSIRVLALSEVQR